MNVCTMQVCHICSNFLASWPLAGFCTIKLPGHDPSQRLALLPVSAKFSAGTVLGESLRYGRKLSQIIRFPCQACLFRLQKAVGFCGCESFDIWWSLQQQAHPISSCRSGIRVVAALTTDAPLCWHVLWHTAICLQRCGLRLMIICLAVLICARRQLMQLRGCTATG